ncbi:Conserved_hypothetical protein [Hexamita inflata]|uniref:Uncharacterized protein n=1 Tax=Hexamita inflata TaxID=28002 RepID=A0AA86U624_9EUKA|nr:Conserved hypothetical protein [Hexamita inflata]
MSVNIPQQLNIAALICLKCDVNVSASDFAFVASGQNISGFVLSLNSQMVVTQSLFQLRTFGFNAGGLLLNSTEAAISLESCNISSFIEAKLSGSVAVFVSDKIYLTVNDVRLCSNAKHFGIGQSNLKQNGSMVETCAVCKNSHYAYGLCIDSLEHGCVKNDQIICADSFNFDGDRCSCPDDQTLNGSSCVDILASVSILLEKWGQTKLHVYNISNDVKQLDLSTKMLLLGVQQIQLQTEELGNLFMVAQINLANNLSFIEQNLEQSYKQFCNNLQKNISIIENWVLANTTNLTNNIQDVNISFDTLKSCLNSMNSTLQTQISQSLDLNLSIITISQDISTNNQTISQQQATLQNLSAKIQCMNNRTSDQNCPCYLGDNAAEWVGSICKCFTGAKLVQGKCACIENAALVGKSCVCIPQYTILQGDKCVCTISNTILNNGSCKCTIPNTVLNNGICKCTIPFTVLQNTQCVCTIPNTVLQNNQCTCTPQYSVLQGYQCICTPQYSSLVHGVCTCQIGATIQNGICTCTAIASQQIGSACSCPSGAEITQYRCVCKVPGTTLQDNKCVCTSDFKYYTARFSGGNFWCDEFQMCCSLNEDGPSFSCSGNSQQNNYGCQLRTKYVL